MKKSFIIFFAIFFSLITFLTVKQLLFNKQPNLPELGRKAPEKTVYNFLLLGYGGGNHEGTYLTDTMMVVNINLTTKKVLLFSIPRDLWVKLPTKSGADFHTKVNAVYQLELGEMGDISKVYPDLDQSHFGKIEDANFVKYILSQVTGLEFDGYLSINFSGFTKAIDILGGIDVDVKKSFTDPQYPVEGKEKDLCDQTTEELFKKAESLITPGYNPEERVKQFAVDPKLEEFVKNATESPELAFPCRYEKLEFKKGLTLMDGKTALKYARSRHSATDGGDFNRAHRQQLVIEAIKNKVLSLGFIPKIIPLMDEFKKDVKTDVNLDIVKKFISYSDKAKQFKITTFVLSDENILKDAVSDDGQFILIPETGMDKWKSVHQSLKNIIEEISPTPTSTPSATLKE